MDRARVAEAGDQLRRPVRAPGSGLVPHDGGGDPTVFRVLGPLRVRDSAGPASPVQQAILTALLGACVRPPGPARPAG